MTPNSLTFILARLALRGERAALSTRARIRGARKMRYIIGWSVALLLGLMVGRQPLVAQERFESVSRARAEVAHVTDLLNASEEARRALGSFHDARRLGIRPVPKTRIEYEIGARRTFFVNELVVVNSGRVEASFELRSQSPLARIWVAVDQLANVPDDALDELIEALTASTPAHSIDPGKGIIANNNAIFGQPPNVAGDTNAVVDVLLYDIREASGQATIGGYVTTRDLCTPANSRLRGCDPSVSNQADVMYLDSHDLFDRTRFPRETLMAVAAHEYQHLIHYAYQEGELTFVNEGLSEWAERLNGFAARSISYLADEAERNQSLFTWRSGTDVIKDYQRAGLFTSYLAERLGPIVVGSIARRPESGETGYRRALDGTGHAFEDLVADFHTANLVNDAELADSSRYGYLSQDLRLLFASVNPERVVDGRVENGTPSTTETVHGGGSLYFRWDNVVDFSLTIGLAATNRLDDYRYSARARVILEDDEGQEVRPLTLTPLQTSQFDFDGPYRSVTLVLAHGRPSQQALIYRYAASWEPGSPVAAADHDLPSDSFVLESNYPNPFNSSTTIRFAVASPQHVHLAVYDLMGRLVETLWEGAVGTGSHLAHFDGSRHPSGVYLYVLEAEQERLARRMLLVK